MKALKSVLVSALALTFVSAAASSAEAEASAREWLALVDTQKYGESWTASGSIFRSNVDQAKWIEMVGSVRKPLDPLEKRTLGTVNQTKSLPGVPDGDYAVVQFRTSFRNKADASERVVLAMEDGQYRVVGYFLN